MTKWQTGRWLGGSYLACVRGMARTKSKISTLLGGSSPACVMEQCFPEFREALKKIQAARVMKQGWHMLTWYDARDEACCPLRLPRTGYKARQGYFYGQEQTAGQHGRSAGWSGWGSVLGTQHRPHARGMEPHTRFRYPVPTIPPTCARDGVFDGWGSVLGTDMPTCTRGWGNVSLSDSLGRDSRAVRALAYVVIWAEDSTSRNQARRTGQTKINANGGRRCRRDGVGILASPCKSMRAAGNMASFPSP